MTATMVESTDIEEKWGFGVQRMILDAEASAISAEIIRRGVAADARVHVVVEVVRDGVDLPSVTTLAEAGGGFDWLAEEPDLYSDGDATPAR